MSMHWWNNCVVIEILLSIFLQANAELLVNFNNFLNHESKVDDTTIYQKKVEHETILNHLNPLWKYEIK